jgi:hypothetical protein
VGLMPGSIVVDPDDEVRGAFAPDVQGIATLKWSDMTFDEPTGASGEKELVPELWPAMVMNGPMTLQ